MSETPEEGSYDFAPEEESGEIPLVEPEGGVAEEEVSGASAVAPAARKPQQAVPDRICPHCGQNIFGKTRGGRCPQCAAPLEHAATDLLQFSSPAWLRTMAMGLMMVGAAIVRGHVVGACAAVERAAARGGASCGGGGVDLHRGVDGDADGIGHWGEGDDGNGRGALGGAGGGGVVGAGAAGARWGDIGAGGLRGG